MQYLSRVAAIAAVAMLAALPAFAYPGIQYAKAAKITMAQARAIAVKAYPGKIVDQELEKEAGGSGLRYSFLIQHGQVKHEVGVDARTGEVLQNAVEGARAD